MNLRTLSIFLILLFGTVACSNSDQPGTDTTASDADASLMAPAEELAVEAESVASLESEERSEIESVDETEGLADEEESAADEITFDEPEPAAAVAPPVWKFKEGDHFRRMTSSQGTSSAPDKIEVAEVFWYGCSHCYNFDPLIDQWKANQPADVSVVRIPVIWNPTNEVHARAMYTAEALGILDEAHPEIFKAIHQQNNQLSSQEGLATFFARLGVDNDAFVDAYNSFGVNSAVKRAENLTRRYGVKSVPVLIVNGKYAVDGPKVQTFGDMLDAAAELAQRERLEK